MKIKEIRSAIKRNVVSEAAPDMLSVLPPSEKCLHGYPIANIRLVEAFMHTKKVSALVTTISADKLSF